MGGVIGLDVGGANTKAVWRDGDARRTVSRPFEVWRDRETLDRRRCATSSPRLRRGEPPELVALTTTAELSDAFRTKREGVAFVLDAVAGRAAGAVAGRSRPRATSSASPRRASGRSRSPPPTGSRARWPSPRVHPDALMLDVGSTTADVIPIAGGRVAAAGRTDLDRLLAGELVYTGALRTNLAAIAPRVPVRGRLVPGRRRSCSRSAPTST